MSQSLLNAKEQSDLILSAYTLQSDKDCERFLTKVERILVDKLFQTNETERALGLSKSS